MKVEKKKVYGVVSKRVQKETHVVSVPFNKVAGNIFGLKEMI